MKKLPNFITGARFLMSAALAALPMGAWFYIIYALCGLSDMADGFLARRLGAESAFGQRLDSIADLLFLAVALIRLWPVIEPGAGLVIWMAAIAFIRCLAPVTALRRFGVFGLLHTYGNKAAGLLLFLYPLTLPFTSSPAVIYSLCALASASALEELAIELTGKSWDADRKSIFVKGKE